MQINSSCCSGFSGEAAGRVVICILNLYYYYFPFFFVEKGVFFINTYTRTHICFPSAYSPSPLPGQENITLENP